MTRDDLAFCSLIRNEAGRLDPIALEVELQNDEELLDWVRRELQAPGFASRRPASPRRCALSRLRHTLNVHLR